MGKIVVADVLVANYIKSHVDAKQSVVGLILGKVTKQKDYIVRLVKSSHKEDGNLGCVKIDCSWLAGHAVEVSHMLPGGFSVIGVFCIAPSSDKNVQSSIRSALYSCYKSVARLHKNLKVENDEELLHWTAIHYDIVSGQPVFCKQFDVLDHTNSGRPCDLKYQSPTSRWSCVQAHVDIDFTICVEQLPEKVDDCLKNVLSPYCDELASSIVEINGQFPAQSETLDPEPAGGGGKNRKSKTLPLVKWGKTFPCHFYMQQDVKNSVDEIKMLKQGCAMQIRGSLFTCAYLPSKSSVAEATLDLQKDLIQNLHHRIDLLIEDLQERNQQLSFKQSMMLPKRVAFRPEEDDFMFFEHAFFGEPSEDCSARIKDTFDAVIDPSKVISDLEEFPEMLNKSADKDETSESNLQEEEEPKEKSGLSSIVGAGIAAAAALLAAAISYLSFAD